MHPGRASTKVSWLKITDPDVVDFMHGVKDLGPSVTGGGKRMDKTDKLLSFNFATAEADSLHDLVRNVPEYVKENLQEFLEKKELCNKMEGAEGSSRCGAGWNIVFGVAAFFVGVYLYSVDANLIRGIFDDFHHHKRPSFVWSFGPYPRWRESVASGSKEDSADDIDDSASQRLSAAMHPGRASTKVSWLKITDPDVVDFMHGVKDLGPSVTGGGKRMDKTDKLLSFNFATAEADSLHDLVLNVPEYVKETLQEFLEKKELCNKMEGAEAFFVGVYLYSVDANLIRGIFDDFHHHKRPSFVWSFGPYPRWRESVATAMHPGRASTKVSWLKITDPDVVDFMHGVKDLGPSVTGGGNRMDRTDKLLSFNFATAEADSLHDLVLNVPEYVKETLQEFLEKKELCNKMEGAEGWNIVFGVAAFCVSVYLYSVDANLIRGIFDDFHHHKRPSFVWSFGPYPRWRESVASGSKEDPADDIDDSASQRLSAAMHPGRASTKVSWLKITDPDVVDFMHCVKDLGPSVTGGGKWMDKTDKLLSFNFVATAEADSLHDLVRNVPEYVKENLQEFLEKKELCNKMEGAEGSSRCGAGWNIVFGVAAFFVGVYLYSVDANLIRGIFDDFHHHKRPSFVWSFGPYPRWRESVASRLTLIDFEDSETTTFRDLAKQMMESRETYLYGVDELTLYLAKRDGKWLRSDSYDVDLFVWGEFPDSIRALLTEENKVDLRDLACNFDFRRADCFPHDEIHMILDPPERVKRLYRQHRQETQHFNERLRRAGKI
ncbi:hypothetical protein PInf_019895 [Phytophthora infestans]|nr:hypothetical protein PInf_019895 [Phytophthora infestans]